MTRLLSHLPNIFTISIMSMIPKISKIILSTILDWAKPARNFMIFFHISLSRRVYNYIFNKILNKLRNTFRQFQISYVAELTWELSVDFSFLLLLSLKLQVRAACLLPNMHRGFKKEGIVKGAKERRKKRKYGERKELIGRNAKRGK